MREVVPRKKFFKRDKGGNELEQHTSKYEELQAKAEEFNHSGSRMPEYDVGNFQFNPLLLLPGTGRSWRPMSKISLESGSLENAI